MSNLSSYQGKHEEDFKGWYPRDRTRRIAWKHDILIVVLEHANTYCEILSISEPECPSFLNQSHTATYCEAIHNWKTSHTIHPPRSATLLYHHRGPSHLGRLGRQLVSLESSV